MHHLHLVHTSIDDNKLLWAVLEYLHPQQEAEGFVLKQRKIWKSGGAKINNLGLVWFFSLTVQQTKQVYPLLVKLLKSKSTSSFILSFFNVSNMKWKKKKKLQPTLKHKINTKPNTTPAKSKFYFQSQDSRPRYHRERTQKQHTAFTSKHQQPHLV